MNLEIAHEVTRMYFRTCRHSDYENVFTTFVRGLQNRFVISVVGLSVTFHSRYVEYTDSLPVSSEWTLTVTTQNFKIKNTYVRLSREETKALMSKSSQASKPVAYLFDINDGIPARLDAFEYEITGDPGMADDELIAIRLGWETATVLST